MSVIIASREEIEEYYQSDALGQSKLKLLLGDLSQFNKEFDSTAEHFVMGSAVDCLLTSTQEEFDRQYYISSVEKKPSDTVVEILTTVHQLIVEDYTEYLNVIIPGEEEMQENASLLEFVGELKNWTTYILDACIKAEWNLRWGDDAKLKNIIEPGSEYFLDLCASFGKTILSSTQHQAILRIVKSLQENGRTAKFFDRETFETLDKWTAYYQFPIYFEYRKVKCKALLDMVFVERDSVGRILQIIPVDLKTMAGNTYYFPSSIRQRRYDIQAAWYTLALEHYFALPDRDATIKPFQFVVESTTYQGKPLVFAVTDSLLKLGRYGRKAVSLLNTDLFSDNAEEDAVLQHHIKGFEDLLGLYIFHSEFGFEEEVEIIEAGINPLKVNWNGYATESL